MVFVSLRAYIEERSIPEPMSGCWIWMRSVGSHGYGNASVPAIGNTTAHRASFMAFRGPIPRGMLIQHSCDNRLCVAPHHLSLGTDASNALDKRDKGRAAKKLTARDVREIAAKVRDGQSMLSVSRLFDVDQAMVQRIMAGRVWRDVLGVKTAADRCTKCDGLKDAASPMAWCERCRAYGEDCKKRRRAERAARAGREYRPRPRKTN